MFFKKFGFLFFVTLFQCGFFITYLLVGMALTETAVILSQLLMQFTFAIWLIRDAAIHQRTPCFDFGMFAYMFLIFVTPVYLIQHYGWKGLLIFLMFVVLWLLPSVSYQVVYAVRYF